MARSKILRVTLAVASVAIIAIAAVTLSTRQREPEFIDRFKGRIVSDNVDRYLLSPGKAEPRVRHYVFTASYEALSEAMRKELTARGWTAERTLRLFSGDSPSS